MQHNFTLQEINDALNTAFVLETGAFSCITSRAAVDRTKFRSDTHFHRSLHLALELLGLTREELDARILQAHAAHQQRLRQVAQPASSRAANTAALLDLLRKQQ